MQFSPKILELNVGRFGIVSSNPGLCLRMVLIPGLKSSGFVVYFGGWGCFWPNLEVVE